MEDVFIGLGLVEGPEIEYEYYNFTALNHPPEHPATPQDTFYLAEHVLLRTHTSPMQVRRWSSKSRRSTSWSGPRVPPDTADATHVPMFHQLEGLAIDEDLTLADLQGRAARLRAADVRRAHRGPAAARLLPVHRAERGGGRVRFRCGGSGSGSERCPTCKGEGWIEILGSGMVDPNVLDYVLGSGYDKERVQGFASAWASSGSRCSSTRCPTACCSTTTCACSTSSGGA